MMGKGQRIVTTTLWGMAVAGMLAMVGTGLWARKSVEARAITGDRAALAGSRTNDGSLGVLFDAPEFALIDQRNQKVTHETLRGNVWVAMVFFTECPGICPAMVGRLLDLQDAVKDSNVKLVAFSLDPETDTPEVLDRYAQRMGAEVERWFLLTGTSEQMYGAADGLKLAAQPATETEPIIHSGKLLLIDQNGGVRGIYDHKDEDDMKRLARDANQLAQRERGRDARATDR